jgi:hypothetical protein
MKLSGSDAADIVCDDHDDWELVQGTEQDTGHSRWSIQQEGVFLHKPTNTHWLFMWQVGATESQDERPFEYEELVEPVQVSQQEKVIIAWLPVKESS